MRRRPGAEHRDEALAEQVLDLHATTGGRPAVPDRSQHRARHLVPRGDQPVRGDRVLDQPVDRGRVHRQRGPAEPAGPGPGTGHPQRRSAPTPAEEHRWRRDDRTEHAGDGIGSIGCRHRVLGARRRGERRPRAQCRSAGAGVAGGLGGCGPLHEGALHELQAGHVGRRVAAVPATGVPAGPDPVPAVPGAQGRRRDAEPAGRPGDRQVGFVHVLHRGLDFLACAAIRAASGAESPYGSDRPRCMSRSGVPVRAAAGCVRRLPASWGVQGQSFACHLWTGSRSRCGHDWPRARPVASDRTAGGMARAIGGTLESRRRFP